MLHVLYGCSLSVCLCCCVAACGCCPAGFSVSPGVPLCCVRLYVDVVSLGSVLMYSQNCRVVFGFICCARCVRFCLCLCDRGCRGVFVSVPFICVWFCMVRVISFLAC